MHSLLGLFPDDMSGLTSAKYSLASTVSTKINTLEIRKPQIHWSSKPGQALGTRNSLMGVGGLSLCGCGEEGDTVIMQRWGGGRCHYAEVENPNLQFRDSD